MSNTKEEIIRNGEYLFEDQVDILQKRFGGGFISAIEGMMDEYAKQQAIAFAEYLAKWGWEMCDLNGAHDGLWVSGINIQYGFKKIAELYDIFLQSQSQ